MIPTPYSCRGCGEPSAEPLHWGCDEPSVDSTPDPLLPRPGVMRALHASRCRGCDHPIAVGDTQGLAATPTGRAWVCRSCLVASLAGEVPAPRDGRRVGEVAR